MSERIISYYGGKHEMAEKLINWMPDHANYMEPFAGGLAVFFKKQKASWNAVNDYDKDIANLYYICSRPDLFEDFERRVFFLVQSRDIYDIIRTRITKQKTKIRIPNIERAAEYFFYIRTSFNNRPGTSLGTSVTKWNTGILEKVAWGRKKLDGVIIENLDVNKFIDKYHKKPSAMWFFDPPYWVANDTNYYGHVFSNYQHHQFKESIDKLNRNPDARIMITYDNHDEIRNLFKDYHIKDIPVKYRSTYEVMDINEIVITNYKIYDAQQSLF